MKFLYVVSYWIFTKYLPCLEGMFKKTTPKHKWDNLSNVGRSSWKCI